MSKNPVEGEQGCESSQTDDAEHAADHRWVRTRRRRCEYAQTLLREAAETAIRNGIILAIVGIALAIDEGVRRAVVRWLGF